MRIVHVAAGLWRDTGGPSEVIPNLCRAQAKAGADVTLCSICGDTAPQVDELKGSGVNVQLFRSTDNVIRFSPSMARFLASSYNVDVIHNHGQWLWPNWCASAVSKRLKSAFVTTPHGTLVPSMLSSSSFKKKLAWSLFDRRLVERADVIHALSPAERDAMKPKLDIHSGKLRVVPNGVHMGSNAGHRTPKNGGTLLFLSRVAPIKGVTQLLKAWRKVAPRFPNWKLKIVGPIDSAIQAEVTSLSNSSERVELAGPVYHQLRWDEYRNASAFILPTLGEGLPTVLLEAAAHRLPVITTREANFDALSNVNGSILTSSNPIALETTLCEFFSLSGEDRQAIGLRGAALIEAEYEWSSIASRWLAIYSEILKKR